MAPAFAAKKDGRKLKTLSSLLLPSILSIILFFPPFQAHAGLSGQESIDTESVADGTLSGDSESPGGLAYVIPDGLAPDEMDQSRIKPVAGHAVEPPAKPPDDRVGASAKIPLDEPAKETPEPESNGGKPSAALAPVEGAGGLRMKPSLLVEDHSRPIIPEWTPPDITRGGAGTMEVSVTFDGGFESEEARTILKALRERGIKTTIFLTGMFIRLYPDIVREIVRDGHEVGNHTMNHPHLTDYARSYTQRTLPGVTKELISRELKKAAEAFKAVTGVEMAPVWRAPYGEVNDQIRKWAFEEGYAHVGWTTDYRRRESLDTLDWVSDRSSRLYRTPREIKERVLNFGREDGGLKGGIILMHLGTERKSDKAAYVLGEMTDVLMKKGYRFVTVSKLLEGNKVMEAVERQRRERVLKSMALLDGALKE